MSTPKTAPRRIISALLVAFALVAGLFASACSQTGGTAAPAGDTYTLAVIGPNASDEPSVYVAETPFSVDVDAWSASQQAFDSASLEYDASNSDYGVMLNSITSPISGEPLAWDETTGNYWQLFVNGVPAETGIDGVAVEKDMSIVWYYSAFGDPLPVVSDLAQAA
jgi:hypothetical protein